MNNIGTLENCYGCGVCVTVCPQKIITLEENRDGFFSPKIVHNDKCIECGLCLKICAFNDDSRVDSHPVSSSAVWSEDEEVRAKSSSGGISFEIGRKLIDEGYLAVGVKYDCDSLRAKHYISSSIEDFRDSVGSKYIPSYTVDAFDSIDFKKKYFVTGTPCQIASFRKLISLRHAEDNFILLDFFCHGVPSLLLWDKYVSQIKASGTDLGNVKWRDKQDGWHNSFRISAVKKAPKTTLAQGNPVVYSSGHTQGDLFYELFLGNYCLNHCCYKACKYKMLSSDADIRIGDFWGKKYAKDNKGVSSVIAFTERGEKVLGELRDKCHFISHSLAECCEGQMRKSPSMPFIRRKLLDQLQSSRTLIEIKRGLISFYRFTILPKRIYRRLKRLLKSEFKI